jgi:hypothetical protein
MRLLISLVITLSIIVALGLWSNYSLQASTDELTRSIDKISISIEKQQWEAARKQTDKLDKIWQGKAAWWPIMLEHQEIDNIEFSLARFKEYVNCKDKAMAQGQLSELRLMIRHIPQKEAVNIKNIL